MTDEEKKKCKYCGGTSGYYLIEIVKNTLTFNLDNEPIENDSDPVSIKSSLHKYCIDCNKPLGFQKINEYGEIE